MVSVTDWNGNYKSVYSTCGASNHSKETRAELDYYATDPKAVQMLLELEEFSDTILEPAAGELHIVDVLRDAGKTVCAADIVERGRKLNKISDFLKEDVYLNDVDIITNPPYSKASEFVERAMALINEGNKVAMFLKLQFLEGQARKKLFEKYPPKTVYVSSSRLTCGRNGCFDEMPSAVAYAWFVWVKGFKGNPIIKWFN